MQLLQVNILLIHNNLVRTIVDRKLERHTVLQAYNCLPFISQIYSCLNSIVHLYLRMGDLGGSQGGTDSDGYEKREVGMVRARENKR